jgi:hypothetical protein
VPLPTEEEASMLDRSGFPRRVSDTTAVVVIALLGLGCVLLSGLMAPRLRHAPLFPLLETGIGSMNRYTIAALVVLGLAARLLTRLPVFVIGLASIAILPAALVVETLVDPSSHNLFLIEFVVYLLLQLPALLGAALGHGARWLLMGRRG